MKNAQNVRFDNAPSELSNKGFSVPLRRHDGVFRAIECSAVLIDSCIIIALQVCLLGRSRPHREEYETPQNLEAGIGNHLQSALRTSSPAARALSVILASRAMEHEPESLSHPTVTASAGCVLPQAKVLFCAARAAVHGCGLRQATDTSQKSASSLTKHVRKQQN